MDLDNIDCFALVAMTIRGKAQGSIMLCPEEKAATQQLCFFSKLEIAFSNFSVWKIYNPFRGKPNATSFNSSPKIQYC